MLPFTTKTDLEVAAKQADVSVERRTAFLNTILAEHSLPHARAELERLWSTWLKEKYPADAAGGVTEMSNPRATTPTQEDTDAAIAALAAEEKAGAAGAAAEAHAAGAGAQAAAAEAGGGSG